MFYENSKPSISQQDDLYSAWVQYLAYEAERNKGSDVTQPVSGSSENWYIVRVNDGDEDVVDTLNAFGIPCHNLDGKTRYKRAIAFPAQFTDTVFEAIYGGTREYKLEDTNVPNMYLLVTTDDETYGDSTKKLSGKTHLEGWKFLLPVIEWADNEYGVKIDVDNPHGSVVKPEFVINDNFLRVHFFSTPSESSSKKFTSVFGISPKDGQGDGLEPTGDGTPIADDRGQVVAEYVNGNLYILFDLPHGEWEGTVDMFKSTLKAYFDKVRNAGSSVRESVSPDSRDLFVRSCNQLYERNIVDMQSKKTTCERGIDECAQKIVSLTREKDLIETKLEPLAKSVESRREIAGKEYDILRSTDHVENVVVNNNVIQIFTDSIAIPYGGKSYNIGKFRIDIYTDGSHNGVRAFNLTRARREGRLHHPHIKEEGVCCLGNIQEGISKLIAECQYAVLAQMMIRYLLSYNPESTYAKIEETWG
jgi:hypothetical protein